MAITRARAHEVVENGLQFEAGVHFSSGTDAPSHAGVLGDRYFRTNGIEYRYNGSGWELATPGGGNRNADGGSAATTYLPLQSIDGGNANG